MNLWLRSLLYRLTLAILRLVPRGRRRVYRLVILKLDRLGDGVLALGAVRLLIKESGGQGILLIVSSVAEALFRREFPEAELLVMPPFSGSFWPDFVKTMARHASKLRSIRADHLVCLRHQASDYLHAIVALMQVRQVHASCWPHVWERVCLSYPKGGQVAYPQQAEEGCLELEAHRRVVQEVLGQPVDFHEILPVLQSGDQKCESMLLVCPVAGSMIRQYPPELLAQAVKGFLQNHAGMGLTFCMPPGADDAPWTHAMKEAGLDGACHWVRPESLEELLQAINAAHLVLAPDSAPAHLVTAMNKPGVFLLGGGHYGMFAPWRTSGRQIWLNHPMSCNQCRWSCVQPEPFCITRISPAAIAAALEDALMSQEADSSSG